MKIRFSSILLMGGLILAAPLLTSCENADRDFYSEVIDACDYKPTLWGLYDWSPSYEETTLTPACQAALEGILPFDEESFAKAPRGFKNKIMEAFQTLLSFDLALPAENTIFGTHPAGAGAIPQVWLNIARRDPNMKKAFFNYVLQSVDELRFNPKTDSGHSAYYWVEDGIRVISFYPTFWEPGDLDAQYRLPIQNASILIHEARHGDGISHTTCPGSTTGDPFFCDRDLNGPYAINLLYPMFVAYGNADWIRSDTLRWWAMGQIQSITSCRYIQATFQHVPPELTALMRGRDCQNDQDATNYYQLLGILPPDITWDPPLGVPLLLPSPSGPRFFPIDP